MARRERVAVERSPHEAVLLDTGILVALYNRNDALHSRASSWLAAFHGQLHTVEPVLTEAAFFLPAHHRAALADLVHAGALQVHSPDAAGYARIAQVLRRFANQDPDWADACLVWLAEQSGIRRIATVDVKDFSVYRIHGRAKFLLEVLG